MRIRIQPYKSGSQSAKALSEATNIRRVRLVHTRFRARPDDLIVSWGSNQLLFPQARYLNHPSAVELAQDKRRSYEQFTISEVPTVPHTTDSAEAREWLREGHTVLARTLTRASAGHGIEVISPSEGAGNRTGVSGDVPAAPLYTRYVKKRDEYRVHVFRGRTIDVQQKLLRSEYEGEPDFTIRNLGSGWVYCRGGVEAPAAVLQAAEQAVEALSLDFGAADVGYNRHYGTAQVYEVNTAPGLTGTTLESYTRALQEYAA